MPFPSSRIKVGQLNAATPTPFDAATLQAQLQNVGLSCAQINEQNLNDYIIDVSAQMPAGAVKSFAIKRPSQNQPVAFSLETGDTRTLAEAAPALDNSSTGNWTISATGDGYGPQLEVIQYPDHFNWLYDNRATTGFTGNIDNPPDTNQTESNADAVKKLFVNVGVTASATLVKGLDQDAIKSALSNAIAPLTDAQLSDYNVSDSRTIFLVDNYNQSTGEADGLGVLFVSWTLKISDYKRKTKDGGDTHNTFLSIKSGSVLYSDPGPLCADYNRVLAQFKITDAPACS